MGVRGFYLAPQYLEGGYFDFLEDISYRGLSLYDCLHGWCEYFALELNKRYSYSLRMLYDYDNNFIHAFCSTCKDTLFIDARGITDNWNEFIEEYIDFTEPDSCIVRPITVSKLKDRVRYRPSRRIGKLVTQYLSAYIL